jgi:hypothetical protein
VMLADRMGGDGLAQGFALRDGLGLISGQAGSARGGGPADGTKQYGEQGSQWTFQWGKRPRIGH